MHHLSGVFILEENSIEQEGKQLKGFSICFTNKTRYYYADNDKEYNEWRKILNKVTGYQDLTDSYEITNKLGSGKYGIVRQCYMKANKREAAIKIINKKNIKLEELQLARTEIEILKMCQHPNIIRLYDVLENHLYIYISMFHIIFTNDF